MSTTAEVKEYPIALTRAMVLAVLAGAKTQLRKELHQLTPVDELGDEEYDGPQQVFLDGNQQLRTPARYGSWLVPCPHGVAGDQLWVQEEWRIGAWRKPESKLCVDYAAAPELDRTPWLYFPEEIFAEYHKQSWEQLTAKGIVPSPEGVTWPRGQSPTEWRDKTTMPRVASRIQLEIVNVRIERLLDISEGDALADGGWTYGNCPFHKAPEKSVFALWDESHGNGSHKANPWVWVQEFQVVNYSF